MLSCGSSSDQGGRGPESGRPARSIVLVAVLALLVCAAPPLTARATATLNVPGDFPTIQADPGANCVVGVRFTPSAAGAVLGQLAVSGSAGALSVPLSGTGVAGRVSLQPASLTFGRVRVGRQSAAASITLTNSGNGTLNVGAVSLQGLDPADFLVASNPCTGAALAPGASCSMSVALQPAASGTRTATLTIASDAPGSSSTVPLSGTGR